MAHEFGVRWDGVCYICKNPLNIRMKVSIDTLDDLIPDMVTFQEYHPLNLTKNRRMWKIRGGRAYRCCMSCYDKPWPIPNLRDREVTGRSPRGGIRSGSLTIRDIYIWFKSLHLYMKMEPSGRYRRNSISEITQRPGLILSV